MADQNSQFYAILTNVGAAKQANADALGIPWKITHMGVGDANGTEPTPNASQTSLIAEWRRAPLNQLKVDDNNSSIIVAEQVIPADEGGKWIREVGLYDIDGNLVAVANCPPTFKPLLSQGSGRTQVVRLNLIVSSSSNVELKIDPAVVLATREWVTSELAKQDFKHSVVAATTGPVTLSGLQTIDGVVLTAGTRVLVKNQAAAKDNGIYVAATAAWARSADADISAEVTPGMLVLVERGTVNADSAWQLVTDAPITLGVTALAYEMAFGRTGVVAGTYRSVTVDAYGRVTAATNPTTVAGYGLTDVYTRTQVDTSLALKANLASPALTGTPTAPTPAAGTNTTQLANTAFVQAAIAALVASSPAALDTLNELAAALGNDPNFAATMTNALALKAPLASPLLTGDPRAPTAAQFDTDTSLATTEFVQRALGNYRASLYSITASRALTVADVGMTLATNNTYNITLTLPNVADVPGGAALHIYNRGLGGITSLVPPAGGSAIVAGSVGVASMDLLPGDSVTLVRIPGDGIWYALHGSAANRYSGVMRAAVWDTPAQFDVSTKLATTEFVQRALGNYSKYTTLNASIALNATHVGALLVGSAAMAGGTVTLPLSSSVPAGSVITISAGAGEFTLAKAAGDLDISIGLSSQSSLAIGVFESIILASTGSSWRAYSGSVPLKYHSSFSASLASNGYQKLPSGLIKQWGSIALSGAGVAGAVTFPIAFPNANLHVVVSATGTPLVDQRAVTDSVLSNNGMNVAYYGSGSSSRIRWEAIGY